MKHTVSFPVFVVAAVIASATTHQNYSHADTRPASKGVYSQIEVGGLAPLGDAAQYFKPGAKVSIHLGTDLFSWLSVGLQAGLSTHEATVPAPPVGEYFQIAQLAGEARLGGNLGPVALFVEGSAGIANLSTNILEKVQILSPGQRNSPFFGAVLGLEYQLQNRHYALGLTGGATLYSDFASMQTAQVTSTFRYTY